MVAENKTDLLFYKFCFFLTPASLRLPPLSIENGEGNGFFLLHYVEKDVERSDDRLRQFFIFKDDFSTHYRPLPTASERRNSTRKNFVEGIEEQKFFRLIKNSDEHREISYFLRMHCFRRGKLVVRSFIGRSWW